MTFVVALRTLNAASSDDLAEGMTSMRVTAGVGWEGDWLELGLIDQPRGFF